MVAGCREVFMDQLPYYLLVDFETEDIVNRKQGVHQQGLQRPS